MNVGECIVISNGELFFPAKVISVEVKEHFSKARIIASNKQEWNLFPYRTNEMWHGASCEWLRNKKFHKPLEDRENWLLVDTETGICEWWDVDSGKRIAGTLPHLRKEFLNNSSK